MVVEPISIPRNAGILPVLGSLFTSLFAGKTVLMSSNLGAAENENDFFDVPASVFEIIV